MQVESVVSAVTAPPSKKQVKNVSIEGEPLALQTHLENTAELFSNYSKTLKDIALTKDVEVAFKKLSKSYSSFQSAYIESLSKKTPKAKATKKKSEHEPKRFAVYPFVSEFIGKEGPLSRTEIHVSITSYVKAEKEANPEAWATDKKASFKLLGKLQPLFQGIEGVMKERGVSVEIPAEIKYTEIMGYLKYCIDGASKDV